MAEKKPEVAKAEGEAAKVASGKEEAVRGGSAGGFQAWLPLLVTVVLMPLLAFATTKLLIIPRVVQARETAAEGADREDTRPQSNQEGGKEAREPKEAKESRESKDSGGKGHGKKKQSVPITKVIVNVAGSMGTRYLMTSFTLVGTPTDFKNLIEENKDQLLDLANTAMASKTI